MRNLTFALLTTLLFLPATARADLNVADLPGSSTWYFHVDFKEMRAVGAGTSVYDWLDDEVFEEIRDDIGVDFDEELDELTAYAVADSSPVIVLQGPFSRKSRDKLLAAVAEDGELTTLKTRGKAYHYVEDNGKGIRTGNIHIDSIDEGAYFSFALDDKIIVTPSKEQMEEMLANGGRIAGSARHDDALFVLSAERNLVQAGANAEQLTGKDDDWDSRILRNTRQLALLVADVDGKLALDARLEIVEADMANSLANVARGLIGLASFSDDMDPQVAEMLRGTRIDVNDSVLKISMAMDPDAFVKILED